MSRWLPWSTSVTVTLAAATVAPVWSLTVPTMLPASFCAHAVMHKATHAKPLKTTKRKRASCVMAVLPEPICAGSPVAV
jgi:hypothetical protein